MSDVRFYEQRREQLKARFPIPLPPPAASTGGVDHVVLISSDLDATIAFYTEILGMPLTRIAANRDDPTSTHIFFDLGGGNLLAFFDFPEARLDPARKGIGALQHLAVKVTPAHLRAVLGKLRERRIRFDLHGTEESGSAYLRDPDGILLEMITGSGSPS